MKLFVSAVAVLAFIVSKNLAEETRCIDGFNVPECADFKLTNATTYVVDDLCVAMPYMVGCQIQKRCANAPETLEQKYCEPFSILSSVCLNDMPKMKGCKVYTNMCGIDLQSGGKPTPQSPQFSNTTIKQCSENPPLARLPPTKLVNTEIKSICDEMTMDGCEKCQINPSVSNTYLDCDMFDVYAMLCKAMPDMKQCESWKNFCEINGETPYCADDQGGHPAPVMKMYFHDGINDYILFTGWVPKNDMQYAFSLIACFLFAVLHEGLAAFSSILEAKWANTNPVGTTFPASYLRKITTLNGIEKTTSGVLIASIRAIIKFFAALLGYSLMLIAMTYNAGIFFSVIFGFAFGTFLFGGYSRLAAIQGRADVDCFKATACC